jgi:hypothetical protein
MLITNEFHEFYWSTILETSDDGEASYGPKFMHIFNMFKLSHSHREYDTRGWCSIKSGPNRAKVGPASRPGVGAFSNSALPTCQGRSVYGVSNAQSWCGHKLGCPPTLASRRPDKCPPPERHFQPKHRLNLPINTPVLLLAEGVRKVRFSFL